MQRARNRILSADVLVVNHTLFFTMLGGISEVGRNPVSEHYPAQEVRALDRLNPARVDIDKALAGAPQSRCIGR